MENKIELTSKNGLVKAVLEKDDTIDSELGINIKNEMQSIIDSDTVNGVISEDAISEDELGQELIERRGNLVSNMESLAKVIDVDALIFDFISSSADGDSVRDFIESMEFGDYKEVFDEAAKRSESIKRLCEGIASNDWNEIPSPLKPSMTFDFKPIGDGRRNSNLRILTKPGLKDIADVYAKKVKAKPTIFSRLIVGLCNILLKPLKMRLFFK
jgi:hypothetical protein